MSLSTTRWLFWGSLGITVIGACVLAGSVQSGGTYSAYSVQSASSGGLVIAAIIVGIAVVMTFVAWIGALIHTAQFSRWGWFVSIFLLGSLALLAYTIAFPDTPVFPQPAYVPPPQPPYYQR